jgi:hypothetical protein
MAKKLCSTAIALRALVKFEPWPSIQINGWFHWSKCEAGKPRGVRAPNQHRGFSIGVGMTKV